MQNKRSYLYKIFSSKFVAIYDRYEKDIAIVSIEEDLDEIPVFTCDIDGRTCDHIRFVKKIPEIAKWIKESKEEARL